MTREEIKALLPMLPPDNPYGVQNVGGRRGFHPRAGSELALGDPAFGWTLARICAEAGQRLPPIGVPSAVIRANGFLLGLEPLDANVALAQMMNLPQCKAQRDLLRGLLICDTTVQSIGELCRLNPDVIGLFECLFWNCLERKTERAYIAQICQQTGAAAQSGQGLLEDLGLNLLRIAFRTGRVELVLAAAGVASPKHQVPVKDLYQQVHNGILALAATAVANRPIRQDDHPSLNSALKLIAKQKQKRTELTVIPELSIGESAKLVFDKVCGPKVDYEI